MGLKSKVIVFILCFVPLWTISIICIGRYYKEYGSHTNLRYYTLEGGDYLIRKFFELDTVSNVDVMVVGSSHAYRGFDPRLWEEQGLKLFNLGSSSQSFVQTWQIVEEKLHVLEPKLAIIEVNPYMLESDGLESTLGLLPKTETTDEGIRTVLLTNNILAYNAFVYDLYREICKPPLLATRDVKGHKYIKGGFVEREMMTFKSGAVHQETSININCVQELALRRTINTLEENNVQILLIQAPITKEKYSSIRNSEKLNRFFSAFGHPYYNFNLHTDFDSELEFYDSHHLNQAGVIHFQELIFRNVREVQSFKKKSEE